MKHCACGVGHCSNQRPPRNMCHIAAGCRHRRGPTTAPRGALGSVAQLLPPAQNLTFCPQPWFRRLFPAMRWGAELNARITPLFFSWLVGECAPAAGLYEGKPAMNVVKIKKCRYLEVSMCCGMCVNLCRTPTTSFFTEQLGMPMSMEPNFEDLSCEVSAARSLFMGGCVHVKRLVGARTLRYVCMLK